MLPSIESKREAKKPDINIIIKYLISISNKYPVKPINSEPNKDPNIPLAVTPPDSPASNFFPDIISIGFVLENFPISVPQVSEFAAAIAAMKE